MTRRKHRRSEALTETALRHRAERARKGGDEAGLAKALTTLGRVKRLAALAPQEAPMLDDHARFEAMSDDEFYAKLARLNDGLAGTREGDGDGLDSDSCS
ncbi:MAG: hypothetical protein AAFX62_16825 [Pseudomonadota bacterium]